MAPAWLSWPCLAQASVHSVRSTSHHLGVDEPPLQQVAFLVPLLPAAMDWALLRSSAHLRRLPAMAHRRPGQKAALALAAAVVLSLASTSTMQPLQSLPQQPTRNREYHAWFSLFRPGSGASVDGPDTLPSVTAARWRRASDVLFSSPISTDPRQPKATQPFSRGPAILATATAVAVAVSVLILMVPQGGGVPGGTGPRDGFNYRIPPTWSPETDHTYSFRAYMTDIALWVMLTDLQPHQQCAAIIMRLGGSAREMARTISPQEMMEGGFRNGVAMDPVTYLLSSLHARFAALEEETRLNSMTEMLAFGRRSGESINALLARYEIVRQRAATEGNFVMSVEGCALQLLRACNIQPQHLMILLQPFGGKLPSTDAEFNALATQLRRFGHISEGSPGNIASALQGPMRQARPGAYFADDTPAVGEQEAERLTASESHQAFFGDSASSGVPTYHLPHQDEQLPLAPWAAVGGSRAADTRGDTSWAYPASSWEGDHEMDSGTDTDTSSDSGTEEIDDPALQHMSQTEAAEHVYLQYRRAKRKWRRFTNKPVRRFRRVIKHFRHKGRRKGKGKGGGRPFFWTQDDTLAYLNGKGKGKRSHSSGKGFGRRKNPKDRDGNIMKCRICNSEEHFAARCPQKGKGKGGSSSSGPSFLGLTVSASSETAPACAGHEAPPWSADDFYFDHSNTHHGAYPVFEPASSSVNQNAPAEDPMVHNDPWTTWMQSSAAYGPHRAQSTRGSRAADPSSSSHGHSLLGLQPLHVTQDDELSSSHSQNHTPREAEAYAGAQHTAIQPPSAGQLTSLWAQLSRQPGPVMPPQTGNPRPMEYMGVVPNEPLERREGQLLSDDQLMAIMSSQAIAGRQRKEPTREVQPPVYTQQPLPLTSLSVAGAQPVTRVTLPQPEAQVGPMDKVLDTIRLVQQQRDQRAAARAAGNQGVPQQDVNSQEAGGSRAADAQPPEPTPTPSGSAAGSQPHLPGDVSPVVYDGDEYHCPICTEDMRAGEMVCRLRCRHMFHTQRWQRFLLNPNPDSRRSTCPNCRGSGTMIAAWRFIDPTVTTQTNPATGLAEGNELDPQPVTPVPSMPPTAPTTPVNRPTPAGSTFATPQSGRSVSLLLGEETEHSADETTGTYATWASPWDRDTSAYHVQTRLADGRPALVVDPGSVGNLSGDAWAKEVAKAAARHGKHPEYQKRPRPLRVSGVGQGAQTCVYDCKLPVALRQLNGETVSLGCITTPTVSGSELPGLLGLTALRKNRAILDFQKMELHFCGPGDYKLDGSLPPGTDSFQLEVAPSGHLVLPCCEYESGSTSEEHTLTLMTKSREPTGSRAADGGPARSRSRPPPPPKEPPQLLHLQPPIVPAPPGLGQQ